MKVASAQAQQLMSSADWADGGVVTAGASREPGACPQQGYFWIGSINDAPTPNRACRHHTLTQICSPPSISLPQVEEVHLSEDISHGLQIHLRGAHPYKRREGPSAVRASPFPAPRYLNLMHKAVLKRRRQENFKLKPSGSSFYILK